VPESLIPINQRIAELIKDLTDDTQKRFAESIGVAPSMISDLFGKRQSRPGYDMLYKIGIAYPQVRMDWLINGRGDKYRLETKTDDLSGLDLIPPQHKRPYSPDIAKFIDEADDRKKKMLVEQDLVEASFTLIERQTLGLRIKKIRLIRGLSLSQASASVGITEAELNSVELAENEINNDVLSSLANLYEVPDDFLKTGIDNELTLLRTLNQYQRQTPHRLRADIDYILERLNRAGI
jgi:transcriptional regulator with XRE-family HTH domain